MQKKDEDDFSWSAYIEGTLFYLEDIKIPISIIEKIEEEENKQILEKLNSGLLQRGSPDYSIDY